MKHQCHPIRRPAELPATSALLGTSLLITRSPRHSRALAGLLRAPAGRITGARA